MESEKPIKYFYFASESVGEGHPDKLCDQISDALIDACLEIDPNAILGMEAAVKCDKMMLLGEITMKQREMVNAEQIARDVCKDVGYDSEEKGLNYQTMEVSEVIPSQSKEITEAIRDSKVKPEDLGAGDQGMMFGYATDEAGDDLYHPLTHTLANKMAEEIAVLRKSGEVWWLRPDCKTQVCMKYKQEGNNITPVSVHNILISTQHEPDVEIDEIRSVLTEKVINKIVPDKFIDPETQFVINPSGSFVHGGPEADAGLTGRKIIVDTYGGWCPHGGGAFSGKDPSKIDRTATYYARYVAKSIVAAGLAKRVLIQVSYAISVSDPLNVYIESYGTAKEGLTDDDLLEIVKKNFNFRPYNMIEELNLRRPIFRKTATFGHFGRNEADFTWEKPKRLEL